MNFGDILSGNNSNAAKKQERANQLARDYINRQSELALGDIAHLYGSGDTYRTNAYNSALALMGDAAIPQMAYFQEGNVGAQNALLAGMPQFQNALFGNPVDYSQFQPVRFDMPGPENFQAQLPYYQRTGAQKDTVAPPAERPTHGFTPGIDPSTAYRAANTYNKMAPMFGGEPLWGASGGSSGGGGAMAGMGPWAALAAGIVANESAGQNDGRRADFGSGRYWKDIASGAVGLQDGEYIADKAGIGPLKDLSQAGQRYMEKVQPWEIHDTSRSAMSKLGDWLGGLF